MRRKWGWVHCGLRVSIRSMRYITVRVPVGVGVAICVSICVAVGLRYGHLRVATVVLLAIGSAIAHVVPFCLAAFLEHLHLGLLGLVVLGTCGGEEIDEEAEHVEAVDEGYTPFKNSGYVPNVLLGADCKGDSEANLGDDEKELDPEGDSEDGMFPVVNT